MPCFNEQEASECSNTQQKQADDLRRGPSLAPSLDECVGQRRESNDHAELSPALQVPAGRRSCEQKKDAGGTLAIASTDRIRGEGIILHFPLFSILNW